MHKETLVLQSLFCSSEFKFSNQLIAGYSRLKQICWASSSINFFFFSQILAWWLFAGKSKQESAEVDAEETYSSYESLAALQAHLFIFYDEESTYLIICNYEDDDGEESEDGNIGW